MRSARLVALVLLASTAACAIPDPTTTVHLDCPDRASFAAVSPFLEDGCGTLYCHGAPARPLRIQGFSGLRRDPSDRPGGDPTTVAEVDENYRAVCGLEPEIMSAVVAGQSLPEALLLVQKPRNETHHKAGIIVKAGDDGDTCLTSWLGGQVDGKACQRAAALWQLPP
ncbi:MAG: hypothetical protein ABJE95_08850 [Byssovorax sp.]